MREIVARRNAHANSTPDSSSTRQGSLAAAVACRYCQEPIYVAICADGKWRSFEKAEHPATAHGVWAWRKHRGMEETDRAPGNTLHFCAQYDRIRREDLAL